MADTNQTNNKGILESEFSDILKLYTDHILKADSAFPPQNKVVHAAVASLQDSLDKKTAALNDRVTNDEQRLNLVEAALGSQLDTNITAITDAVVSEVARAKRSENDLSERIKAEKERLDVFLHGEDIEGTAIDTLKEIQRWMSDDETDTANLLIRVGGIEDDLVTEAENRAKDIEDVTTNYKNADNELTNTINGVDERVQFLEREVVLISCGNSKF